MVRLNKSIIGINPFEYSTGMGFLQSYFTAEAILTGYSLGFHGQIFA
jgi:hypothetical protein